MAKNVSVTWVQKRQFVGSDSAKHSIVISSKDEDNNTGVKPSDLLLMALGSCSAYDVVGILEKKRLALTGLEVTVTGEQDADPPWTFRKFHLEYVVRGKDLPELAVADAIRLSEEKYCSVAATVRGVTEITSSYRLVEE
jgi:putative redox protein